MLDGALQWTRLTTGPLLATGVASLVTLAAYALLLRSLPVEDAGLFALSMALVETLSLFGALGQVTLITRLYSRELDDAYDWLRDLARLILLSCGPIAIGVLVSQSFYPLSSANLLLVAASTLLTVPVNLSASMLNARLHHTWGALLLRLPHSLLIVPALLATLLADFNELNVVLSAYCLGAALIAGLSLFLLSRYLARGPRRISLRQHVEGTIFVIASSSQLLLDQGLLAIAGVFLRPAALATFAAVAILLRPFRLVTNILSMILTPRFVRADRPSYARPIILVACLAGLAALFAAVATPPVADLIYGDRYTAGYGLVPWLALVGALLVIRSIPVSHMWGRAPSRYVNRVVMTESGVVVLAAVIAVLLIRSLGITGLAMGLALGHLLRASTTFGFWRRFRRTDPSRGQPAVAI